MSRTFPTNRLFTGVVDQIPIDPAFSGPDPQLQQFANLSPTTIAAPNMAATPYNTDPRLEFYSFLSPESGTALLVRPSKLPDLLMSPECSSAAVIVSIDTISQKDLYDALHSKCAQQSAGPA